MLELRRQGTTESLAGIAESDVVHVLWPAADEALASVVDLMEGRSEAAYARAAGALRRIRAVPQGQGFQDGVRRTGNLRQALRATARAALRTGRYAEAEALVEEAMALPVTQRRPEDPQDAISAYRVQLAHATTLQGRRDEARKLIERDLARYAQERAEGASGLTFVGDYAYALYVDAIASDEVKRRQGRLDAARRLLESLSAEARQLQSVRELERWIGEARATSA
jgi:tetratricopeptide (TPR) repeat protein